MTSYANASEQLPDFEISYRFLSLAEGGRQNWTPYQHYRCDWSYEGDNIVETGIYMIWPEFLAADGSIFPNDIPVPISGIATMWIVSPEMRLQVHSQRIKLGIKGYFMEGQRRVAEAIVTGVIGLHSFPNS
jgi:hypothetical protein